MARPSPEKLKLLAKMLEAKGIEQRATPGIPRRSGNGDQEIPLSFGQQRLWFLQQLDPGSSEYNDALTVRITGAPVDADLLERCLQEVVRRHEVLRTTFVQGAAGLPVQQILPELKVPLQRVDLRGKSAAEQEAELDALWRGEVRGAFALDRPPLIRATLAQLADDDCEFGLTMHHIVSDGVAYTIVFTEMSALYEAFGKSSPSPLAELPVQFADYACWERDTVTEAVIRQKIPFWQRYLGGELQPVALPVDRPRAAGPRTHDGAFLRFRFPDALFTALQDYCRAERVTSNWVLLAAYFALWHCRGKGQLDLAIGTPSSVRGKRELEQLVGFFVQTLILRLDLSDNPTFRGLIRRAQEVALEVSKYEDVPFDRVFQAVRPGQSATDAPLIQAWIAPMKNLLTPLTVPGAESTYRIVDPKNARFDVSLILDETPEQVTGYWEYDTALFDAATVERLYEQFQALLRTVLRHPDTTLALLRRTLAEDDGASEQPRPAARKPMRKPMRKKAQRRPEK